MNGLKHNFPISNLTTLKIGGPAKMFFCAKTEENLIDAVKYATCKKIKFIVIGGGSNLLVSDKGFYGLVIKNEVCGIEQKGLTVCVKAGTPLQNLLDFTIKNGLSGIHKLSGIPGTVGGAVYGNAGAFGQTISDHLVSVTVLDATTHSLKPITLPKKECGFDYRDSNFKRNHYIILDVHFSLPTYDKNMLQKEAKEVLQKRLKKYPPGVLCPGSFFKNLLALQVPEKILANIPNLKDFYGKVPAWYFLEEVGAKGEKLGKIKISDTHANLFINLGGGTALDFYKLAKKYHKIVKQKFGITLEPEVQLINLPSISP